MNIENNRYFTFNQTGNILISTTEKDSSEMPNEVKYLFNEVSVFFSAMIKSLSQTRKPDTDGNADSDYYNINDYDALSSILKGSNYFVNTSKQQLFFKINPDSDHLGRELIGNVLGIDSTSSSLSFADSMFSSLNKETLKFVNKLSEKHKYNSLDNRVSNIFFICEYIKGMSFVSVVVLHFKLNESLKFNKDVSIKNLLDFQKKGKIDTDNFGKGTTIQEGLSRIFDVLEEPTELQQKKNISSNFIKSSRTLFTKEDYKSDLHIERTDLKKIKSEIGIDRDLNITDIQSLEHIFFRKDTYTFISPKAIDLYAKEYNAYNESYDFIKMQESFKALITNKKNAGSEKPIE